MCMSTVVSFILPPSLDSFIEHANRMAGGQSERRPDACVDDDEDGQEAQYRRQAKWVPSCEKAKRQQTCEGDAEVNDRFSRNAPFASCEDQVG